MPHPSPNQSVTEPRVDRQTNEYERGNVHKRRRPLVAGVGVSIMSSDQS
jgi:hypothetical protein